MSDLTSRYPRLLVLTVMLMVLVALSSMMAMAQDEQVLVIGHVESTDSLDPARGFTQTTGVINRVTYSTLVTFPDEDASDILPMLATDWSVSDDGLSYTFVLREGVTFVSGNPLTAADVAFSLKRLQNVRGNPSFLANNIDDVVANDDGTVTISLVEVDPAFLALLTNYAFSVVDSETVIANGGTDAEDAAETDEAEVYLNGTSAGTGPYILESWTREVQTVLVRNPDFWGEQPFFDRVIIQNIPEPATQKLTLESGDIDMALDLSGDQISTMTENPDIEIFSDASVYTHFLLMNADPELGGPVSDPLVQRAIRYALDYEGYKILWGGRTPASNLSFVVAGALQEDQAMSRDLDMARELLAEAGYPDGFSTTLSYPDFSWQGVNMNTNAQKLQADLAEVGINVSLNPGELQVSLEEYRQGLQGFGYWFWGPDILDPKDFLSFLPGGKVADERANWSLDMVDPEIQALIEQVAVETDNDARLALYGELQLWMQENGIFAPFNNPALQTAYRADIDGYILHPAWLLDVSLLSRSE
jgi:peptide/nickel transport system substrate-binding protein